jgi:uncharacterized protein (TIGR02466 family)
MINCYYPTPVYHGYAQPMVRTIIQNDFQKVIDDIKWGNGFQKNRNWESNTHRLSDPTFSSNLIEDYDLKPFFNELRNHVRSYMQETGASHVHMFKVTQSWMTLTGKGEHAIMHTHGNADIAGVYYVKTSGNDGRLYFRSPNRFIANSFAFSHAPDQIEVGKFVLFPGWLDHGVRTNETDSERISVSFNITFTNSGDEKI